MKYILILLMLWCSTYCYGQWGGQFVGQNIDSIFKVMKDSGWSTMSVGDVTYVHPPDSVIHWWTPDEQKAYEKWYKKKMKDTVPIDMYIDKLKKGNDSLQYYYNLQKKFTDLAKWNTAKYYSTNNKKYWDQAMSYLDSSFKYYDLAEKFD